MTLEEIKSRVIFQHNADEDDLEDYEPAITGYVNKGYDLLLDALCEHHVGVDPFPALEATTDEPKLPVWTHDAICDYATWLVYRNGNPQKQSRGHEYLANYMDTLSKLKSLAARATVDEETGEITISNKGYLKFYNVYPPIIKEGAPWQ